MTLQEIIQVLTAARLRAGHDPRDAAAAMGYSQNSLSYWETQRHTPRAPALVD